jgi:hypothetical protein
MAFVTLGAAISIAAADEIVHFTNGAEMTVRSHVVVNDMLKLDLGGNNSISFPIAMVGKIVSAGQDVFLNPVYHPSNQGVAAPTTSGSVAMAAPVGLSREGAGPGRNGARLGEAADGVAPNDSYGAATHGIRSNPHDDMTAAGRARFDPLRPMPAGGVATIEPVQVRKRYPGMSPRSAEPAPKPAPPAENPAPPTGQAQPPASGGEDSGDSQDPPPSR